MTVLNTGWTNRYQGPFDANGRPVQPIYRGNPANQTSTGLPRPFDANGRPIQPIYRGNAANQPITGLPNVAGLNLQQMRQLGKTGGAGAFNALLGSPQGQAVQERVRAAQSQNVGPPQGSAPQQGEGGLPQTGGGFPVSEAGGFNNRLEVGDPNLLGGGYVGEGELQLQDRTSSNDGGYDGSGINPNGMYTDPNGSGINKGSVGIDIRDPGGVAGVGGAGSDEKIFSGTSGGLQAGSGTVAEDIDPAEESALSQLDPIPSDTPATGLAGYEQAMGQGFDAGMGGYQGGKQEAIQMLLNAYRGSVDPVTGERKMGSRDFDIQETNRAADAMRGYSEGGAEAQQLQAALTGALGPDAQARAIANFQESPGQKYLREQTERGVLRNAASVGGLGGGNVLKALQANAAGLASQDFQNQFNRLSNVADRGMTASGTMADLFSNLGSRQARMRNQMGTNIAGVSERYGQRAGDLGFNTGAMLGANRQRVGDRIADNIAATSGAVAGQQSGDLLGTLLGGDASNLVNLINAAQSGDAASNEALAALLANLTVGEGSNISSLKGLPGITNTAADALSGAGNLAGGIGAAIAASDHLLKTDIRKLGEHNGHNLYSWKWNAEGERLTGHKFGAGVLATEVLEKTPEAVSIKDGYLAVDYSRIF